MTDTIQPSVILKPQMLSITSKAELYRCYMSFIKGGALFIPFNDDITPAKINPGQKMFIILNLMDSKQKIPINGKVVWINRSGMVKGYGVSFGESNAMKALKEAIENQIADLMLKKEHNYTF